MDKHKDSEFMKSISLPEHVLVRYRIDHPPKNETDNGIVEKIVACLDFLTLTNSKIPNSTQATHRPLDPSLNSLPSICRTIAVELAKDGLHVGALNQTVFSICQKDFSSIKAGLRLSESDHITCIVCDALENEHGEHSMCCRVLIRKVS